jgi:hypothetical protein
MKLGEFKMKIINRNIIFIFLSTLPMLISCNRDNSIENNVKTPIDTIKEKHRFNDAIEKSNNKEKLYDLMQLKKDLDSFVLSVKKTNLPFTLFTDTIRENSDEKVLWTFKNGIFELVDPDSTALLVRHHFLIPKTSRILRLNILEIKYSNIQKCNLFFNKFVDRKDYKVDLLEGAYLDFGLTGTTDYVIKINETILWFNISCQYSKKEFNRLIEIFRSNLQLTGNEEVIKCFCGKACE